jgi:hypothetical protein
MVTVPDHAVHAAKIRSLSSAISVEQYHVVLQKHRVEWEEYANQNTGWVQEALFVQASDPTFVGKNNHQEIIDMDIEAIEYNGIPTSQNQTM